MMDPLVLINYIVFAVLFSLFFLELGAALLALVNFEHYKKKITTYIAPVWEITGTFSVFYLVNVAVTFPGLVPAAGLLYIVPILVAGIVLVVRDSFLAYSAFARKQDARPFAAIYGICTIITMLLFLSVLGSTVSGIGVNLGTGTANLGLLVTNPFNLMLLVSVLLLVSFAAIVFFEVHAPASFFATISASVLVLLSALALYVPSMFESVIGQAWMVVPELVLFAAIAVLYLKREKFVHYLVLPFLALGIFTFELFEYPSLFGGAASIGTYLAPMVGEPYILMITIVGGAFLAVALGFFVYVHHMHKKKVGKG